jgi:hypothetical protein
MLKKEVIWREILVQSRLKKKRIFTQKELALNFGFSLSTVHNALKAPRQNHSIKVTGRFFVLENYQKLLYLWANEHSFKKEILYQGKTGSDILELEKQIPPEITFGLYSAFKFYYQEAPADYDHLYLYIEPKDLETFKKRFQLPEKSKAPANIFFFKKDSWLNLYREAMPLEQIFVDIWNSPEWYAKDFLKQLEEKLF